MVAELWATDHVSSDMAGWQQVLQGDRFSPHSYQTVSELLSSPTPAPSRWLFCHSGKCEVLSRFNDIFLITNKCEHLFICLLISL